MSDPASSSPGLDSPTPTTSDAEETGEAMFGRGTVALSVAGTCPDSVCSGDSPADVNK